MLEPLAAGVLVDPPLDEPVEPLDEPLAALDVPDEPESPPDDESDFAGLAALPLFAASEPEARESVR